jgi:hypothetical protein
MSLNLKTNETLYEEFEKTNIGCFSKVNIKKVNHKDNPDLQLKMRENKTKLSEFIKTNFAIWDGYNLKVPDINAGRRPSPVNRLIKDMKFLFSEKGKITNKIPFMRKLYETEKSEKSKQMRRLNNLAAFAMTKVKNPEQAFKVNLDSLMKDLLPQERKDFLSKNEELMNTKRYLRGSTVRIGSEFNYEKYVSPDKNIDSSYDSMQEIIENFKKNSLIKKQNKLKLNRKFTDGGILKSNISKNFKGEIGSPGPESLSPNLIHSEKIQLKKTLTNNFSTINRLNTIIKLPQNSKNNLNPILQTQDSTQCNDSNFHLNNLNLKSFIGKGSLNNLNANMSPSDRGVKHYTSRDFFQNHDTGNPINNHNFYTPNQPEKFSRNKIKFASDMTVTATPNSDYRTLSLNPPLHLKSLSSLSNLISTVPSKTLMGDFSSTARQNIDLKYHQITKISKKIKKDFTKNLKKLKTPLKKTNQLNESFDKEVAKELNNKFMKNKKDMKKNGIQISAIKVKGISRNIHADKATLINLTDKFVMMNENTALYLGDKIKSDYEQKAVKAAVSEELEFRKNFPYDMNKELTPTMTFNNEKMKKIQYNINKKHTSIKNIHKKIILSSPDKKVNNNDRDASNLKVKNDKK